MVTIHQFYSNGKEIIKFAKQFYQKRFPNAVFHFHDYSIGGGGIELAHSMGYELHSYNSGNGLAENDLLKVKNDCWKNDTTEWSLVCQIEELLDINQENLLKEAISGETIISSFGFQMTNMEDGFEPEKLIYGFRDSIKYDKFLLFRNKVITEMNWDKYSYCEPKGDIVKYSINRYALCVYKYITLEYLKSLNPDKTENELKEEFNKARKNNMVKLF